MSLKATVLGASIAALCLAASPADAGVVSFSSIVGAWSNASPSSSIDFNSGAGTSLARVRWGGTTFANDSGYDFLAVPGTTSVTVPPSPSSIFDLGTFTHINNPISGNSIDSIRLTVNTNVAIDSVSQGNLQFVFDFFHDETPNGANPCQYGGNNNQGVNINGCADRVTTAYNTLSQTFTVGSDIYTIDVLGFKLGNNPAVNEFFTKEDFINDATLQAQVKLRSEVNVPEPATLGLIGLSLMLVGANGLRRRKR